VMHGFSTAERPYVLQATSVAFETEWKGPFPRMAPRITTQNSTGILLQGLCEEYRVSGNSATLHNRRLQQWPKLRFWTRGTRSNIVSTRVQQLVVFILKTVTALWDHLCCIINNFPYTNFSLFFQTVLGNSVLPFHPHLNLPSFLSPSDFSAEIF
jgi:hypothetical protein